MGGPGIIAPPLATALSGEQIKYRGSMVR